ncbi:MAG: 2Fe-2S iron-sulfur cluster-binding protein [Acidimicrobiales bacterium]
MPTIRFLTSDRTVDFSDGDDVNLLRVAIRKECGVPYKCASGNCGTDRVRVVEGAENLERPRRRERETLGEDLLAQGYRLACQTYVTGDVAVTWDPDQTALHPGRAADKLRARWLSASDTE